jgi:hypothetical protein
MMRAALPLRSGFLAFRIVVFFGALASGCHHAPTVPEPPAATVVGLVCDSLPSPPSVGAARPLLGWRIESTTRDWRQSAWQIRVASEARLLADGRADLWDSGRTLGAQTLDIPYRGRPLASRQRAFWSVRVWDASGRPSEWSAPAEWTTGILENTHWHARWIAAPADHPRAAVGSTQESVLPQALRAPVSRTVEAHASTRRSTAVLPSGNRGEPYRRD